MCSQVGLMPYNSFTSTVYKFSTHAVNTHATQQTVLKARKHRRMSIQLEHIEASHSPRVKTK